MRVAVIADIHGNLPALEAVLGDIREQRVDEVLVGGDLVGRGPDGSRVSRRIAQLGWPSVRGNHEDYLLEFARGNVPRAWQVDEEWAAARWMSAELSNEDLRYLDSFPPSLNAAVAPGLLLVHGTPESNSVGIGPWTRRAEIKRYLAEVEEPLLVCCHTHRPLIETLEQGSVVNVGSVGLPFNGDHRAQYAIFSHHDSAWTTELRQVEYDLEEILERYGASGFAANGGVTATLLRLELEHALPYLVPFLSWASHIGRPPRSAALPEFLALYSPGETLKEFYAKLKLADGVEDV